jgi:hypothetical protein
LPEVQSDVRVVSVVVSGFLGRSGRVAEWRREEWKIERVEE